MLFLADNGDIYVYDEDENYILFKESERMTLTFILLLILARKMIGGFYNKGSYRFHLSTRQVRLDNPINIPNARLSEIIRGISMFLIRPVCCIIFRRKPEYVKYCH